MTEKKIYPNFIKEKQRVTLIKSPETQECWKAKAAAEQGENVSEKVKCPLLAIYNHKGVCAGNRKQRRNLKCYK